MAKHIKRLHPLATTSPEPRLLALAITVSKTVYDGAVCSNHGQKGHLHADQDLDQATVGTIARGVEVLMNRTLQETHESQQINSGQLQTGRSAKAVPTLRFSSVEWQVI
ncbi:hypothetical protein H257_11535 [Aphanomyces astaci]|uniref:Uncharacterized protein n=1 Tax=Aphanomyces astaci TaxID=112090 RepID=W4G2C8_APHAT|nr:hypothetical protein H257_11535 [Aphanomyces astaci]ETV73877.1 hypothetical protein H257_11535 [Aphanomyces astaci]|eukprot:XP_009836813.1 hypothetical protein H257_11535 [Aphanomyces astaci]